MHGDFEEAWSNVPAKALHPVRVPIIEVLWRIGKPLSAVELVDVLDGFVSMWEAAHHLRALKGLGVVETCEVETSRGTSSNDRFHVRYRLTGRDSG